MKQFEVFIVELNPTKGAEINKTRPCVIISPDAINRNLKTVIVAPLTHTMKNFPSRAANTFNGDPGDIVLDQLRALDKTSLIKKLGPIDSVTASNVKAILQTMFS